MISGTQSPVYGSFVDTVCAKYTGRASCGSRSYKIRSVANSASASLSAAELVINTGSGAISVTTSDAAKVGTHTATVSVFLASYPTVDLDLTPFTITMASCFITAVSVLADPNVALSTKTYTLSSTATLGYQLTTTQTPACGLPATDWIVLATGGPAPSLFQTITNGGLYQVGPIPSDLNIAGTYTITVTKVNLDG